MNGHGRVGLRDPGRGPPRSIATRESPAIRTSRLAALPRATSICADLCSRAASMFPCRCRCGSSRSGRSPRDRCGPGGGRCSLDPAHRRIHSVEVEIHIAGRANFVLDTGIARRRPCFHQCRTSLRSVRTCTLAGAACASTCVASTISRAWSMSMSRGASMRTRSSRPDSCQFVRCTEPREVSSDRLPPGSRATVRSIVLSCALAKPSTSS